MIICCFYAFLPILPGKFFVLKICSHGRKSTEKFESTAYYPHFLDMDPELHSSELLFHVVFLWRHYGLYVHQHLMCVCLLVPRDNSRLLGNKLIEEQEKAIEFDQRRLSEFQLTPKPLGQGNLVNPMQELKLAGGIFESRKLWNLFRVCSMLEKRMSSPNLGPFVAVNGYGFCIGSIKGAQSPHMSKFCFGYIDMYFGVLFLDPKLETFWIYW